VSAKDIAAELLPILKDGAKSLWEGPEDTEFLKTVSADIAKLGLQKLGGADVSGEIAILEEAVRQRAFQKQIRLNGIGETILPKIIGIAAKVALALL